MTAPTLVSTTAGIQTYSGADAMVTVTTQPGDLVVLFIANFDATGDTMRVTFGSVVTPLEEITTGGNRHVVLCAEVATGTSSTYTFRLNNQSFPRSALYVCDVIRGGSVDAHSASVDPATSAGAQFTNGVIPGVTTTTADCLVRHYVGAIDSDNSFSQPQFAWSGWSNGTLSGFTAPDPEYYYPGSSAFRVEGVGATTGTLASPGATGSVSVTSDQNVWWLYGCLSVAPVARGYWSVGGYILGAA